MVLEPSLDIDKLQDPEEYFLAHEKLESKSHLFLIFLDGGQITFVYGYFSLYIYFDWFIDAKKELQRQRGGVLMDLNQHNPSTTTRLRRPGILGYHQYF